MGNAIGHETAGRTERPWGWFETVSEAPGNKIKRIRVHPGQQLSLQKHHQRAVDIVRLQDDYGRD